ncbi:DedA family protein [Marinomonas epiphytica]
MISELQAWLVSGHETVGMMFVGIILLSYLLEDLAIVTAATLAVQELIAPSVALIAIFIGIATGDLGLYLLGKYGRSWRCLRYRALSNKRFKMLQKRLNKGTFWNLFIIRFVPGLRTAGFTLSGFLSVPLSIFIGSVICATALWTGLVFSLIYYLGASAWSQASEYQWLMIPIAFALLFVVNRVVNKSISRGFE